MDVIRLLSDSIANQIAAGEVVQRPASVVKELMENSIDAKASSVQLIIKESGKQLIQVIDNGQGMSPTDARMCFERHATSKIKESADLFNIRTMGFRGEALASIAAVAQVELRTKRAEDELATLIKIEGSDIKTQEFVQSPQGTNLAIKNLFFNVPARRNFLKSNPVEMKHIIEEFQRIALAHPEVQFSLFHNDIEIYNLPEAKLSKRIVDVLDKSYRDQLAQCQIDSSFIKINGYVGNPQTAKKARGEQYFFVNKRFIKSSYLHHAVTGAFESTIPQGSHPFYALFIEIDPSHIDINIHPTKTEIKFDDEKAIYAILRSAVKQAIGVYNLTPSIDFEADINIGNFITQKSPSPSLEPQNIRPDADTAISNFDREPRSLGEINQKSNRGNWEKLFEGFGSRINQEAEETQQVIFSSKANRVEDLVQLPKDGTDINAIQVHFQYIIAQVKSGLMLIDQQNAYERIFYEKYLKEINTQPNASQQLLFPKTVTLTAIDYAMSFEIIDMIRNIGFNVEEFGQNTYLINGVPSQFMDEDEGVLFKSIIEQYKINENNQKVDKKEALAKTLAKRNATKMSKSLSKLEMSSLINQLFETSMPSVSPDGKPVMSILSLEKIANLLLN
ncbi:DNA mismatch repair endonuclease MutL [Lacihabitans soyangensis]|uniref:DNA mismatch repair protein MutL n=1 Tax=Lacihabitans soyangensis TaxID=869394 RepID=A0AAE3H0D6_9BACT|nr:DNA mismatch repair endonuclease MutL [Lacihabitans soyangensis]MCP9762468.1 DNA mismatch repair endonuclease MutL [Lacihabitans soyangensis]